MIFKVLCFLLWFKKGVSGLFLLGEDFIMRHLCIRMLAKLLQNKHIENKNRFNLMLNKQNIEGAFLMHRVKIDSCQSS